MQTSWELPKVEEVIRFQELATHIAELLIAIAVAGLCTLRVFPCTISCPASLEPWKNEGE